MAYSVPEELQDFRNFLYITWKHLGLPDPTKTQYDIAEYVDNGPRRCCIQAFRGVGKSWITSAYVCHQLLLNPSMNILVVSASKTRSDDFSTFTLRLINEMPLLKHLIPREEQRSSKIAFDVGPAPAAHAPSVKSVGITGQLTGSRADLIVADDVESLNNSLTQQMRDKIQETIKEFDAVLKPDGRIVYLGTPQTEMSIYNVLPERGYEIRIWPARVPSEKAITAYGHRLAPYISDKCKESPEGTPVDPQRFDSTDLAEREASYGKSGFALQYMLDTSLSDVGKYPLRLSDLIVHPLDAEVASPKLTWASSPELAWKDLQSVGLAGDAYYRPMEVAKDHQKYTGAVMSIDPAGMGKDETAYAVVKILNGQLFLTASGGYLGGYTPPVLSSLGQIAKAHKVNHIIVESNFGDGMFTQLLKPVLTNDVGYPCTIEEVRHSVQKEKRIIDTLEPVMNSHRLIVDPKVVQNDFRLASIDADNVDNRNNNIDITHRKNIGNNQLYQLFYQMSRLTFQKGALRHDDRLDALSIAVGYWVEHMERHVEQGLEDYRQEQIDKSIESFMESHNKLWGKTESTTWM
tara:strand:- start:239 stop:1966 length:1728 start_codon:yes stop_codon:yes gene_type:complete